MSRTWAPYCIGGQIPGPGLVRERSGRLTRESVHAAASPRRPPGNWAGGCPDGRHIVGIDRSGSWPFPALAAAGGDLPTWRHARRRCCPSRRRSWWTYDVSMLARKAPDKRSGEAPSGPLTSCGEHSDAVDRLRYVGPPNLHLRRGRVTRPPHPPVGQMPRCLTSTIKRVLDLQKGWAEPERFETQSPHALPAGESRRCNAGARTNPPVDVPNEGDHLIRAVIAGVSSLRDRALQKSRDAYATRDIPRGQRSSLRTRTESVDTKCCRFPQKRS